MEKSIKRATEILNSKVHITMHERFFIKLTIREIFEKNQEAIKYLKKNNIKENIRQDLLKILEGENN